MFSFFRDAGSVKQPLCKPVEVSSIGQMYLRAEFAPMHFKNNFVAKKKNIKVYRM